MLDQETKRKIDNARDILVGKVPDPKSQVEQITIALIYKFMDDMDKDSEGLGGKATFFTGEFEKYAWPKIVDTKIGGQERLNLYAEAIAQMNHNKNIPQLFRDIFKNAFLPYRDPETLNMFLKEINGFHYDHSENLGDAYEYLLAVLGSQGEAGQFRTPRQIIDFMVNVVEPKKHETGLDPACGTAGFLISFYNYILRENSKERKGDQLTPDERKRLMGNLTGYDISPDMVRISLVNMYLHGFSNPMIHEYDTLTSEDRWQEASDIILANPPFMSPKGGIRPHKRFSVKANRSEVLFVDYIAEHMATNGRAGVIVPEGIIFQSGNAYKALRKMLVDGGYLYAVVSLPAGVFNPYSGVKTSILFMDKVLAKRTHDILFVKVENDGFDLGAQRKPIDKDDLPRALDILLKYKRALQEGKVVEFTEEEKQIAHAVPKAKIGEKGEYNLTADRYKKAVLNDRMKWPIVRLCELCEINPESAEPKEIFGEGTTFTYIDISSVENGSGKVLMTNQISVEEAPSRARRIVRDRDVLLSTVRPNLRAFAYMESLPNRVLASTGFAVLRATERLDPKFLYLSILADNAVAQMIKMMGKGSYPSINSKDVENLEIPLPPLSVQQEIVAEIEGYQKIIDGAKQIVDNWKPKIEIDESWPTVTIEEIASEKKYSIVDGPFGSSVKQTDYVSGGVPLIRIQNITNDGQFIDKDFLYISEEKYNELKRSAVSEKDLLISRVGTIGNVCLFPKGYGKVLLSTTGVCKITANRTKILPEFLYYLFRTNGVKSQLLSKCSTGVQKYFNLTALKSIVIPLPPIEVQQQIVTQIEEEQHIVDSNKKLIEIYEGKIKAKIAEVWG